MCVSDSDSGQTTTGLNNPQSGTTGACIHPCESSERSSSAGLNTNSTNPEVKSTSGLNNNQESHNHPCSMYFFFEGGSQSKSRAQILSPLIGDKVSHEGGSKSTHIKGYIHAP
jgi:hypothetical protein